MTWGSGSASRLQIQILHEIRGRVTKRESSGPADCGIRRAPQTTHAWGVRRSGIVREYSANRLVRDLYAGLPRKLLFILRGIFLIKVHAYDGWEGARRGWCYYSVRKSGKTTGPVAIRTEQN